MKITSLILVLCLYPFCLSAVDLERAVEMLEATGDFETAEPVAFKLTQEKPEHYYRIEFLRKYPNSDFAEIVYLQTWKDVKDAGNIAKLQSFVKVMPRGIHSLEGLDRLFALYKIEDAILGYQEYIKEFPNSPQAVEALLAIFRLAFQRALTHADKLNSVQFFDEYIRTFPISPHVEEANRKSEEMEYAAISETLNAFTIGNLFTSKQDQKETIARKLYNEMRSWKKQNQLLISQRKYNLLQKNLFIDTKAVTEMMDREETIEFRNSVVAFQQQTTQQLNDLNELYRQESRRIKETIRQEAQRTRATMVNEGEKIRDAIGKQGQRTRQSIRQVTAQGSDFSYENGWIADAVNEQTNRMMDEARRASYEQQRMFEKASEQARRQAEKSRRCAGVLTKKGKYPMFSGCP